MLKWEYHYCEVTKARCERGSCGECPADSEAEIVTSCRNFRIRMEDIAVLHNEGHCDN